MNLLYHPQYLYDNQDEVGEILDGSPILFSLPIGILFDNFWDELQAYLWVADLHGKVIIATNSNANRDHCLMPGTSVSTLRDDKVIRKICRQIKVWTMIVSIDDAPSLEEIFVDLLLVGATSSFDKRVEAAFFMMGWSLKFPGSFKKCPRV